MKIGLVVDPKLKDTLAKESSSSPHLLRPLLDVLEEYDNKTYLLTPDETLLSNILNEKYDFIMNTTDKEATKYRPAQYIGLFDIADTPYLGSRMEAIGICKNKALFKTLMQLNMIAVPKFQMLKMQGGTFPPINKTLKPPLIAKFFFEGIHESTILDQILPSTKDLDEKLKNYAKKYHFSYVLLEEFVEGRKFYVPILGNDLYDDIHYLPAIEYRFPSNLPLEQRYFYEGKLVDVTYLEMTESIVKRARKIAHKAYNFCGCRDYSMAVFFWEESTNNLLLHEINPITSLLPQSKMAIAAEHIGLSYSDLINDLILTALKRYDVKLRGKYGKRDKELKKEQEMKKEQDIKDQKETTPLPSS